MLFRVEDLQILKIDYENRDRPGNLVSLWFNKGPTLSNHNPIKKLGLEKNEELLAV